MKTACWGFAFGAMLVGLFVVCTRGADDRPAKHTCNCGACDRLSAEVAALKAEVAKLGAGRVAIVDLDRIAQELGWTNEMNRSVDAINQQLQARVGQLRDQLKAQVDAKVREYGDDPTAQQRESLAQMAAAADRQLQVAIAQASQEANRQRLTLVMQYRDDVRPVAKRIAKEAGQSVVMVPLDGVLYFDPECDITRKVADAMPARKAATQPAK
jgi:Skp family chaperone for outer membrane proteins